MYTINDNKKKKREFKKLNKEILNTIVKLVRSKDFDDEIYCVGT